MFTTDVTKGMIELGLRVAKGSNGYDKYNAVFQVYFQLGNNNQPQNPSDVNTVNYRISPTSLNVLLWLYYLFSHGIHTLSWHLVKVSNVAYTIQYLLMD
jgi:hypothetical protein